MKKSCSIPRCGSPLASSFPPAGPSPAFAVTALGLASSWRRATTIRWPCAGWRVPDTVRLYALSRTTNRISIPVSTSTPASPVQIENLSTGGNFDMAVDTAGGEFVWLPPGALGDHLGRGDRDAGGRDLRVGGQGAGRHRAVLNLRPRSDKASHHLCDPYAGAHRAVRHQLQPLRQVRAAGHRCRVGLGPLSVRREPRLQQPGSHPARLAAPVSTIPPRMQPATRSGRNPGR